MCFWFMMRDLHGRTVQARQKRPAFVAGIGEPTRLGKCIGRWFRVSAPRRVGTTAPPVRPGGLAAGESPRRVGGLQVKLQPFAEVLG